MTKQQAYEILLSAINQINTTKQNHVMLEKALAVLMESQNSSDVLVAPAYPKSLDVLVGPVPLAYP